MHYTEAYLIARDIPDTDLRDALREALLRAADAEHERDELREELEDAGLQLESAEMRIHELEDPESEEPTTPEAPEAPKPPELAVAFDSQLTARIRDDNASLRREIARIRAELRDARATADEFEKERDEAREEIEHFRARAEVIDSYSDMLAMARRFVSAAKVAGVKPARGVKSAKAPPKTRHVRAV
jgi:uncharacterized coiled-coil DUF342 family protein